MAASVPSINIKQSIILAKCIKYLESQKQRHPLKYKDDIQKKLIERMKAGLCAGFSDEWLDGKSEGSVESLFWTLKQVFEWNEGESTLRAGTGKSHPDGLLAECFEGLINNLLAPYDVADLLRMPSDVSNMEARAVIKQGYMPGFRSEFKFAFVFKPFELVETLKKLPLNGRFVRLESTEHSISVAKTEDGFSVYDPNYDRGDNVDSSSDKMSCHFRTAVELVDHLKKILFTNFTDQTTKLPYSTTNMPIYFSVFTKNPILASAIFDKNKTLLSGITEIKENQRVMIEHKGKSFDVLYHKNDYYLYGSKDWACSKVFTAEDKKMNKEQARDVAAQQLVCFLNKEFSIKKDYFLRLVLEMPKNKRIEIKHGGKSLWITFYKNRYFLYRSTHDWACSKIFEGDKAPIQLAEFLREEFSDREFDEPRSVSIRSENGIGTENYDIKEKNELWDCIKTVIPENKRVTIEHNGKTLYVLFHKNSYYVYANKDDWAYSAVFKAENKKLNEDQEKDAAARKLVDFLDKTFSSDQDPFLQYVLEMPKNKRIKITQGGKSLWITFYKNRYFLYVSEHDWACSKIFEGDKAPIQLAEFLKKEFPRMKFNKSPNKINYFSTPVTRRKAIQIYDGQQNSCPSVETLKMELLKKNGDVSRESWDSHNCILFAARFGDVTGIKKLVQAGVPLDARNRNGETALLVAAIFGHVEFVKVLISLKADVTIICNNRHTALMLAAHRNRPEVVQLLVSAGAPLNVANNDGLTALMLAARNGHVDVVRVLLAAGADITIRNSQGDTALMLAAEAGHTEVVRALITAKIDLSIKDNIGFTALMLAARNGHVSVVRALIDAGAGPTELMLAAQHGCLEAVRSFISAGVDLNVIDKAYEETPLMAAAYSGHDKVVEALITAGADTTINDNFGQTALTIAVERNHIEVLKVLIDARIDLNTPDANMWNRTPLMLASERGHLNLVKLLISMGVNINFTNQYNKTALMLAAREGHVDVVRALLAAGADVRAKNRQGETAGEIAESFGHTEIVKLLKEAEANFRPRISI